MAASGSSPRTDRVFRFGPYELIEAEGELRKNGARIKLQEQPFRVLLELVANAGKVVSREELHQRLWTADTFVDFDTGLNTAIRKLRQALNDDADKPRYIETLARRGYRFLAEVSVVSNAPDSAMAVSTDRLVEPQVPAEAPAFPNEVEAQVAEPAPVSSPPMPLVTPPAAVVPVSSPVIPFPESAAIPEKSAGSRRRWIAAAVAVIAVATGLVVWWSAPPRMPVVESMTQLTNDGQPKTPRLFTDGSRIYFNEGNFLGLRIVQVGIQGGDPALIPTTLPAPRIVSLAPNGSALMIASGGWEIMPEPFWELPLPAGDPHPIGNLVALDGSYTTDGHILLVQEHTLVLVNADGSNPRKLINDFEGEIINPLGSPDGTRVAFILLASQGIRYGAGLTLQDPQSTGDAAGLRLPAILEANADGSGLRAIVDSQGDGKIRSFMWTPDSKYVVFSEDHGRASDLWIVPVAKSRFRRSQRPLRLTNGPLAYVGVAVTPDGKQILTLGSSDRGELVYYDLEKKQFVPFMAGMAAFDPTFSSDGQWMSYTSYPDFSLWRCRSDGSERLQLTYPPVQATYPFISPDGKQVAYETYNGQGTSVISMDGGAPRKVTEGPTTAANWSPDGNFLVFNDTSNGWDADHMMLKVLDVRSGKITTVQGNQIGPQWAAPGKFIAARHDLSALQIYDVATQKWSDLPKPEQKPVLNWAHSPDFKFFYYTAGSSDLKMYRIRMADLKVEVVGSLKDLALARGPETGTQISVAPDNSPVFTRQIGTQEIYSLGLKWP